MKNPKFIYGYIEGIRLDSINTKYAQVGFNDVNQGWPLFRYGLGNNRPKDIVVKDSIGNPYYFFDFKKALNFFHFNGWDYANAIPTKPERAILILRKNSVIE